VEVFYDYIKLNKELRDLDFKKNLETKISLCERAEELLLEPDVQRLSESFRNCTRNGATQVPFLMKCAKKSGTVLRK
jgi:hypothetical protein